MLTAIAETHGFVPTPGFSPGQTLSPHAQGLVELTTLVRDCSISGVTRRVLLLRTDLLPQRLSRPHHLRLAAEALEPLMGAERARRYELSHGRVAIGWRGEAPDRLHQVLEALEHLLQDAPLDAPAMPELTRLFDLPRDGAALLALAASPSPVEQKALAATPPPMLPAVLPPLQPADVAAMEARLGAADVARFARRRTVCRMGATSFGIAWETRFLSVSELTGELAPGRNARANPWLFRRLTRTLDRRMLALLAVPTELRDAGPFSLNLNVGGILSAEFLRFDGALPPRLRGHIVLDLHPVDVMADLPAYHFARAFARSRGYRVLLRGLTPSVLAVLELAALEVDFVELRWSPTLTALDPSALRAGTARWVLGRANEDIAFRWGQAMGIGLFQGDTVAPGAGHAFARRSA